MTPLHQSLNSMLAAGKFEPFVRYIRFPKYKNLTANTRIEFSHPITVLVGANGTNKSSILRALYGVPDHSNLGNLWFSTSIDPIEEGVGERNCFIYGHYNSAAKKVTEVLKIRIRKDEDPDYWEPSRPYAKYNMEMVPRKGPQLPGASSTRWNPIQKEMIYIDFRAALSAFDKFFYYGELRDKRNTQKDKKDFIRTRAPHLKRAADLGLTTLFYRKSERIVNSENAVVSAGELKAISEILGREYTEIRLIRHRFYNGDGYTARLKTRDFSYTEAFAGSGEFSVIRLVNSVMKCAPKTLILLDEPEVSLHPGAQERLMNFLGEQVKKNQHQVVISTHSPALLRTLPPAAIKVLTMDSTSGNIGLARQESLPEEAFFHLGAPASGKMSVVVEDKLAQAIVRKSLRPAGEGLFQLFDVTYFPGGCSTLWAYYIPIFAAENRENVVVFLDGDQKPETQNEFPPAEAIPVADNHKLADIILAATKVNVEFPVDSAGGGANIAQKVEARRRFISWSRAHVGFLPAASPEQFVWDNSPSEAKKGIVGTDYKDMFVKLTRLELAMADFEAVSASDVLSTQIRLLAMIEDDNTDLVNLRETLISFANKL